MTRLGIPASRDMLGQPIAEILRLVDCIMSLQVHEEAFAPLAQLMTSCNQFAFQEYTNSILEVFLNLKAYTPPNEVSARHRYLDLASFVILANRLDDAKNCLNWDSYSTSHYGALSFPTFLDNMSFSPPTNQEEQQQTLFLRRYVSQLNVIKWFQSHPKTCYRVFGDGNSRGRYTSCGITINEVHFCLECKGHEFLTEENFYTYEEQWIDPFLDGYEMVIW